MSAVHQFATFAIGEAVGPKTPICLHSIPENKRAMSPFVRYVAHLKGSATGVSRREWHSVASGEALWFALPGFALLALTKLLPEPQKTSTFWIIAVLLLFGFIATQAFILVVHLKDYRARIGEHE